jgi:oxygen-independent coproporphyrinogen-3 oxidase
VDGCGFCTFPHERYHEGEVRRVVAQVAREVRERSRDLALRERRVDAVYFGGATANLTPPRELARLAEALEEHLELSTAEVTLEGVPRYFLIRGAAALDVLEAMRVRQRRISMGVQTFDPTWLARMGRSAIGDAEVIAEVVRAAQGRGFTTSVDLLFNLPGAPLAHALDDVRRAADLGVEQICVYNLVLTPDLGTEWSKRADLLGAMPRVERAHDAWLAVRERLLDLGYVQRTLTNFERADVASTPRAFAYERASFSPDVYDAVGFGPSAISTFTSRDRRAAKWANEARGAAYALAMENQHVPIAEGFEYAPIDLRLMHLTRGLALTAVDRARYHAFFGTDLAADFAPRFEIAEERGLVTIDADRIALTPSGMFYADAVAGLLAADRVSELRSSDEGATPYRMG